MTEFPKKRLTRADIILVAVLLCLTVFLIIRPLIFGVNEGEYFTVTTQEGSSTYSLRESCIFTVTSNGITLTVEVTDGCVSVTESSCPDKICHSTGKISKAGQSIVCIPAEIVIKIGEGGHADEDFIVG